MAKQVLGDDPFSPAEELTEEFTDKRQADAAAEILHGAHAEEVTPSKRRARPAARRASEEEPVDAKTSTGRASASRTPARRTRDTVASAAVDDETPRSESEAVGSSGFVEEFYTYGDSSGDTFDVDNNELGAESQPYYGDYGPSLRPEAADDRAVGSSGRSATAATRTTDETALDVHQQRDDERLSPRSGRFRSLTDELIEIEQRVRSRLVPVLWGSSTRVGALKSLGESYRRFLFRRRSQRVDELGRDPVYSDRMEPLLDAIYSRYFRVELSGLENIPASGRALLVANHGGALPYDALMLMHGIQKEHPAHRVVRPLVEDATFHVPYLGAFFNRLGAVRACQENGERLLESNQLALVFPEGVKGVGKLFRERYRLQRFGRGGFVKLALRTGAPIIPCAIVGAEETHPLMARIGWLQRRIGFPFLPITPTFPWLGPLGLVPLPIKWKIRIGEPISMPTDPAAERAEDRIFVGKIADQVRQTIQTLLDETLASRRSILWG